MVSLAKESECFNPMIVTSSLSSVRYICSLLNQRWLDIAVEVYHKDARYEWYTVFIDNLEYILDEVLHDRFWTLNVYTNHTI